MKYEVTINGTLPTALTDSKGEDYIKLACECAEAIILDTNIDYQSVDASYVDDGDLDITIRKIITMPEPPTVGKMQDEERRSFDNELSHALYVIPFSLQDHLKYLTITDVKLVLEDLNKRGDRTACRRTASVPVREGESGNDLEHRHQFVPCNLLYVAFSTLFLLFDEDKED